MDWGGSEVHAGGAREGHLVRVRAGLGMGPDTLTLVLLSSDATGLYNCARSDFLP